MKTNQPGYAPLENWPYVLEYISGFGNVSLGADSTEELTELFESYPPQKDDSQMPVSEIRQFIYAGKTKSLHLNKNSSNPNKLSYWVNPVSEWIQIEEECQFYHQEAILSEPKLIAVFPISFQFPIGASEREINYRRNLAQKAGCDQWVANVEKVARIEALKLAEDWIEKNKSAFPPIIKEAWAKAEVYGENMPSTFASVVVFDVGGDNDSLVFSQTFDRRGGISKGWYSNPKANPRAAGGSEEWNDLLQEIKKGKWDHLKSRSKKVVPAPKRFSR